MGALYLAWDPMLEREIAIKLLREDNDELRERFAREARSVARLRHPHIVMIFDVGEQDGQPFIAMEYIKGHTLADMVRSALPLTVVTPCARSSSAHALARGTGSVSSASSSLGLKASQFIGDERPVPR